MKKIVFLIVCFCFLPLVLGIDSNIVLNGDVLNSNTSLKINVTLQENATLFIDLVESDDRLLYEYDKVVYFENNSKELEFIFIKNENFVNSTNTNAIFNLTSNVNSNNVLINVSILINVSDLFEESSSSFVDIVNGEYKIEISTNLIPKTGTLNYEINGNYGDLLSIDCSSKNWFSCPKEKTFNSNNKTTFSVSYSIPSDALIGTFKYPIIVNTSNLTISQNVTFVIFEPELTLNQYVFKDTCFKELDNGELTVTYECLLEKEEHDIRRITQIINKVREQRNISCNVDPEIEYVFTGRIEDDLLTLYNNCQDDLSSARISVSNYQSDLSQKEKDLRICNSDKKTAQEQLINNESTCLETVFETSVKLKEKADSESEKAILEAENYKKNVNDSLITTIFAGILILFFIWWRYKSKKDGWSL
jgi:hypothetical protein